MSVRLVPVTVIKRFRKIAEAMDSRVSLAFLVCFILR